MAQFNFPSSPNNGDSYTQNGVTFVWDGEAWRRQGVAGPTGSQGSTGPAGPTGSQGASGSNGAQGASGTNGAQGAQGAQGGDGDDASLVFGTNPPSSPSSGDMWWDSDEGDLLVYFNDGNSSQWVSTGSGPIGAQGATGSTGAQGAQGATGSGSTGAQGATGSTGAQGAQGDTGSGSTGAQGATGSTGAQGATGSTGAQGSQGHQGATGSGGSTGAQGAQGHQGATGSGGSTGAQGAQGHQGNTGSGGGTGAQGAQGHQGATGSGGSTGAQGASGSGGSTGAQGAQGHQGVAGSTAGTASQVLITGTNTSSTFRPVFASTYGSSPGNASQLYADGGLAYNPGTDIFTAGTFDGSIQTSTISRGVNNADIGVSQEGTGKFNIYRDTQAKNIVPTQDSQFDLGTDAVRWQDVYADNLHGDGTNITGLGGIRQVKSTTNNSTASYTVGQNAYVTVVQFNVSITCSSSSHKVLVLVDIGSLGIDYSRRIGASLAVNGTLISAVKGTFASATAYPFQTYFEQPMSFSYLHSPGTTAQQTYSIQINHGHSGSRTMYFNQSDTNSGACASTITAMEVT